MIKFLRLILLRPIERFLAQCISISTEPSAWFENESFGRHDQLCPSCRFLSLRNSTAFLAEVATLQLLGIGGLTEPYYWLFIL